MALALKKKGKPGRSGEFNTSWELKYGVQVSTVDTVTKEATSVVCLFCKNFGREVSTDRRKRKRTQRVHYYSAPFRADNMKAHNVSQHKIEWEKYDESSHDEKKMFFSQ